jgi:ER membrane protein complex subunit 7
MVNYVLRGLCLSMVMLLIHASQEATIINSSAESVGSHKIEGKIIIPPGDNALESTRILIDEGLYVGIPQIDGTFVICGVPSGSYIVSVVAPMHVFEPVRVDINAKGKIRARKVNFIQPGEVVTMKYPLNFETHGIPNYFQKREVYRLTDVIMNPMFLTLLIPLALLLILPKLAAHDPDMQRDLQQASNFLQPNMNTPDIGDMFANMFGGPKKQKAPQQQAQLQSSGASAGPATAQQKRKTEAINKRRN